MIAVIVSTIVAYSYLAGQSTSIGIARNINAHARARCVAETGMAMTLAAIQANGNWRTTYSHGTWVADAALPGGTVTVAGYDGADANGDGVISNPAEGDGDLADDPADLATLTVIGKAGGATHVLRTVLTPAPGGTTMIVYGEQNQVYCRYRTLDGSTWSNEQSATNVGSNPKWYVAKSCPTRTEVAVCTLNNDDDIHLQFWTGSAWTTTSMLTDNAGSSAERTYDVAYEQASGDLLVAYRATSDATLRYRTATSSSSLSAQLSVSLPTTGNVKWVKLIPRVASNEIFALTLDSNKQTAGMVWNGSAWGNALLLDTNGHVAANEQLAGAYEGQSGRAMAAWSENGLNAFRYRIWSGSSWLAESTGPALPKEPQWLELAADPMSNKMIMASMDGSEDIMLTVWTGSAWGTPLTVETNSPGVDRRPFDVAFERTSGRALAVWGRGNLNNFVYRTWDGSAWSAEQVGPGLGNKVSFAQLVNDPSENRIFLSILQKGSGALRSFIWNGNTFSAGVELEHNCSGPNTTESFMVTSSSSGGGGSSTGFTLDWR